MNVINKTLLLLTLTLLSALASAQRSSELSADIPDTRTMAVQDKVDSLFEQGKFDRAYFIYRNELAPIGDKYAQYMVGYMYHNAMGVGENLVEASAWYRLSAERGTREFVVIRDRTLRTLDGEERQRSDRRYAQLREEYCDLAVLMTSIRRDHNELRARTGTRLGSDSSPITVIENFSSRTTRPGTNYYASIRKDLEVRLNLLKEIGEFDDLDTDPDHINIGDLERMVRERIRSQSE